MTLDRRSLLKGAVTASAAAVAGAAAPDAAASARKTAPADAVGLLYDATLCVGCKACVVACHEANFEDAFEKEAAAGQRYFDPVDLDARAKTLIKLYKSDDGDEWSYVKRQCMHCIDPACVSACMLGAFQKREFGIVTWDGASCIGCRYCQVACPFGIPKFEWEASFPKMVKCELCNHRLAEGKEPACSEVCPRKAVIYGKCDELLAEAHRRLEAEPDRYQPTVYGELEGGGTQVLYLAPANVDFQELGFPDLGEAGIPDLPRAIQHGIYKGFIAPVALYGVLAAVMLRNRRRGGETDEAGGKEA
jgi:Fe-S-cluster-containing dehydrogenase component